MPAGGTKSMKAAWCRLPSSFPSSFRFFPWPP